MFGENVRRLGGDLLTLARRTPGSASATRPIDQAAALDRHRQLEAELAGARAEIERLRVELEAATRPPALFAQMHARQMAIGRLTRLWVARGGDRQT